MGETANTERPLTPAWQATVSAPAVVAEWQKLALQQHGELMDDVQHRMLTWTRRRQEALDSGLDALKRIAESKSPVAMAAICGEWMSGSITRLLADAEEAQASTLRLAAHFQEHSQALIRTPPTPAIDSAVDFPRPTELELRQAAD